MRVPTQRNFGARIGGPAQLGEVGGRHDSRPLRDVDSQPPNVIDETKLAVRADEVLRDRAVGASVDLGLEMIEVRQGMLDLRMGLRTAADLDVEVVAVLAANECDQIAGIAELAGMAHDKSVPYRAVLQNWAKIGPI
jgi:hypothetical protein